MKTTPSHRRPAGFVSLLLVFSTGTVLLLLTLYAYRHAMDAHSVQSKVQLRVDYAEKEEAILRSIVAITPNRAIRAMQQNSNLNSTNRNPLRWKEIFTDSLDLANSRTSISSSMVASLNIPNLKVANSGDSILDAPDKMFTAISPETGYVSTGLNRSLGTGYPSQLSSNDSNTNARDLLYPIISDLKYDPLAPVGFGPQLSGRSKFGLLKYPNINFGYARPGENFVAKRNWWAFNVDVGAGDSDKTRLARSKRNYVLSIYEIPSQLAISASSFMSLGQYASGDAWQNVSIDGGMFVGKAVVEGNTGYSSLSSRRGMTIANGTSIGGEAFSGDPFAAGVREAYQVTTGAFFPVSLASESGRAAFVPISRGKETNATGVEIFPFFDRFANAAETSVLSTTTWNNYSSGAVQCAMRLDVTRVVSTLNQTPTMLKFQYFPPVGSRVSMDAPQDASILATLPAGFVKVCDENQSYTFAQAVDVAYGVSGGFTFRQGLSGTIAFNNSTFGDPKVGFFKGGYWRPRAPFGIKTLVNATTTQTCVAVYPQRFPAFLSAIGAGATSLNSSLVVNVDYTSTGATYPLKPEIPCRDIDYGVILQECGDLTGFTKGFSLVTNLRLYFGDDFNSVPMAPPAGYTPAVTVNNPTGRFLPPCSLFAPEKRYGVEVNPFAIELSGQIGSLAKGDKVNTADAAPTMVRPLDSKSMTGVSFGADRIKVNLSPLRHPAELPPITMMNWLVLLEERRSEYFVAP